MPDSRQIIRDQYYADEAALVKSLITSASLDKSARQKISDSAAALVDAVRTRSDPSMMESFLAEFGLSTGEGVALMCLAEALLRVPDSETVDDLIRDKITPHDWGAHVGDSGSLLVNASTWALMLTGKVLVNEEPGVVGALRNTVRRLGEPVVRHAVKRAMQEMGEQFVLGEDIRRATDRGNAMVDKGYTYSYDMLGEAARTRADAKRYFNAYANAIDALGKRAHSDDIRDNPGISVKLSALHPRYEASQGEAVIKELTASLLALAERAAQARIGLNIDAEEANRLDISLDIIDELLKEPALAEWRGLGVVVQAYGKRATHVIDHLYAQAKKHNRFIMIRLVKGAYWDTEIKLAQIQGLPDYPVLTRKINTDVSYISCAAQLLRMRDRIYPQFATHNAHSCASVLILAGEDRDGFEFQRLHGMGESLHDIVKEQYLSRCRIYAPVGAHVDLLAYLVRRLLENGANSSFVNQIVDEDITSSAIAADPFTAVEGLAAIANDQLAKPENLYRPERKNSRGWDINNATETAALDAAMESFETPHQWESGIIASDTRTEVVRNPARPDEIVGRYEIARDVSALAATASAAANDWQTLPIARRAEVLLRVADKLDASHGEIMALLIREAGKTRADAIAELREAIDFCRYYAATANPHTHTTGRGVTICISPWNFPLAIFIGQVAAALVTGNTVIAKPAEQSTLIAARAVDWMHDAGVPKNVLQLAAGDGRVGAQLCALPDIAGVCFTGSTEVARLIERQLAETSPRAMLIAETGGLNAMLVDSTALNEQAVRDIIASAFQSAGQRCSALRMLYVQKDRAEDLLEMLYGAMDELVVGDPSLLATDVGPVIDPEAHAALSAYIDERSAEGQVLKTLSHPQDGFFVAPTVIGVDGIDDLEHEVFGPVLHVATFESEQVDDIIETINARGYGLTLGVHTRIDARVQEITDKAHVGNIYINRNQIGAIVGSQPFGGEGLSGTGPKAGGPLYLRRFCQPLPATLADICVESAAAIESAPWPHPAAEAWHLRADRMGRLNDVVTDDDDISLRRCQEILALPGELPGPTGESNRYRLHAVGRVVVFGKSSGVMRRQVLQALAMGNSVLAWGSDAAAVADLARPDIPLAIRVENPSTRALLAIDCNAYASGDSAAIKTLRRALADSKGPILRLITELDAPERFVGERAICIDTTAAGGNAELLAANS